MASPLKRSHELPTPPGELKRITLEALARYEASGLRAPGEDMIDTIRERVRRG